MGTKHGPGEMKGAEGLAAISRDARMGTPSLQPSWVVVTHRLGLAALPRWWPPPCPWQAVPAPLCGLQQGGKLCSAGQLRAVVYGLSCARINRPMGAGVCSERFMKACSPVPRAYFPLMEESRRFLKQEEPGFFPLAPFLSRPAHSLSS